MIDAQGGSPFWDSIAGRFFGMSFQEADAFNGAHGTQFIADLMPKTPIYTAMLSPEAQARQPASVGRGGDADARARGFSGKDYVDIFDGGPTMSAPTDQIRSIRDARELTLAGITAGAEGEKMLLASGGRADFAAGYGHVAIAEDGSATVAASAGLLALQTGDRFLAVSAEPWRWSRSTSTASSARATIIRASASTTSLLPPTRA